MKLLILLLEHQVSLFGSLHFCLRFFQLLLLFLELLDLAVDFGLVLLRFSRIVTKFELHRSKFILLLGLLKVLLLIKCF